MAINFYFIIKASLSSEICYTGNKIIPEIITESVSFSLFVRLAMLYRITAIPGHPQ